MGAKLFAALLLLTSLGLVEASPVAERNVYQFGNMISCLNKDTVYNSMERYNGYGCYCGFGGTGEPKDDTDRCCQVHDACYSKASASGECPSQQNYIYVVHYRYDMEDCGTGNDKISCVPVADYRWYDTFYPKCAALMCECDKEAAFCFANSKYNLAYANYDHDNC